MKMAKFVGMIGTISGKVGTTVFSKGENGISYGRAYQPQVGNPKTVLQLDQRAKMNLVGRMSRVTPKALLIGMDGVNARQRRSAFSRNLLNAATLDRSVPGTVVAKIEPEDIIFSQGAELFSASATTPTINATGASISITLSDSALAGRYGERVVVAVVDPSDKAGYSLVAYKDQLFDDTTAKNVQVNFGTEIADHSLVCIYRMPFVLTPEGASIVYESLANDGADIIAKVVENGDTLLRGWGPSKLEDKQVFTAA